MCVYSMIADHYRDKFDRWPEKPWDSAPVKPAIWPSYPYVPPITTPQITKEEFDELRREVKEMLELLRKAKEYDRRNDEPDCEVDEKVDHLRKVAKSVGVDFDKEMRRKPRKPKAKKISEKSRRSFERTSKRFGPALRNLADR